MGYIRELLQQWRALLAALIGLGSGYSTTTYITGIMAPHLLAEFHWSKASFALIGATAVVSVLAFPFIGRLADVLGVRRTALIGIVSAPVAFFLLSRMTGDIRVYIALFVVQGVVCLTTTTTVYSRVVVQHIKRARGLALAIVASGPALSGAIGGPILNSFVDTHGWRAGYQALMVFSIVAGVLALLLLPAERRDAAAAPQRPRRAREDYPEIFRNRAFWMMLVAMVLCNLPQAIAMSQFNLLMMDQHVTPQEMSALVSALATGTLLGRFLCGLALDRFPAHIVTAIGLVMPAIGMTLIASAWDDFYVLVLSVLLIGLAFGSEGDSVGYLVVRTFGVRVYSSVMGMMTAAMATAVAGGSILLSRTLKSTGGFELFLHVASTTVVIGSLLLLLLPRRAPASDEVEGQPVASAA